MSDRDRAVEQVPEPAEVQLPDGRVISSTHEYDALTIWSEIVEHGAYDEAARVLRPGDTLLDVGAHFGLASMHLAGLVPGLRVVACEPVPPTFRCLERNLAAYVEGAVAVQAAVGDEVGETTVAYYAYPGMSTLSTTAVDDHDTGANLDIVLRFVGLDTDARATMITAVLGSATPYTVPRTTVAEIAAANGLDRIGLLKIDVERAELEVLRGVGERLWPAVNAVVMEVHDVEERLELCLKLLTEQGFDTRVEQDAVLAGSSVRTVLATRPDAA